MLRDRLTVTLALACGCAIAVIWWVLSLTVDAFFHSSAWSMTRSVCCGVLGLTLLLALSTYRWARQKWAQQQHAYTTLLQQAKAWLQAGQHQAAQSALHPLACLGCHEAQLLLGRLYLKGHGVERNYQQAYRWLNAAKRYPEAQNLLGVIQQNGWLGHKNPAMALYWFRRAAVHGFAAAQNHLGFLYLVGFGVTRDDRAACAWFLKAAKQGWVDAQLNVAFLYYYGAGVLQNTASLKAHKQGLEKSPQGDASCDFLYAQAWVQNYHQAYRWYVKVAQKGHATAQYVVGVMTELGQGVACDVHQAEFWYLQAALQKHADAIQALTELYQDQSRFFDEDRMTQYVDAFRYQQWVKECPYCAHEVQVQWPTTQATVKCPHCAQKSKIKHVAKRITLLALHANPALQESQQCVLACPRCQQKMRLPKPTTQSQLLVCVTCKQSLRVLLEHGQVQVRLVHSAVKRQKPPDPKRWYDALALPVGAPLDHVKHARKRLMQQYHPDKVAHLDYEQRASAEEKSKQINVAYRKLVALLTQTL